MDGFSTGFKIGIAITAACLVLGFVLNLHAATIVLFVVVFGIIACVVIIVVALFNWMIPPPPPPKSPEQLDQEAAWLRAESRRLDAQAQHEIKRAELGEIRKFTKRDGDGSYA